MILISIQTLLVVLFFLQKTYRTPGNKTFPEKGRNCTGYTLLSAIVRDNVRLINVYLSQQRGHRDNSSLSLFLTSHIIFALPRQGFICSTNVPPRIFQLKCFSSGVAFKKIAQKESIIFLSESLGPRRRPTLSFAPRFY